jgi:protein-tyrosine phosphatase
MAQVVAQKLATDSQRSQQLKFDSAGTHAHHLGERPDPRALIALSRRGYDVGRSRSRRIVLQDFQDFDLILAMDSNNLVDLNRMCPPEHLNKLRLFLEFAEGLNETEVPDPYYGNAEGFERVLDLCEAGASGFIKHLSGPAI